MDDVNLIKGDLSDQTSLDNAIKESKPDEVYNLASQSYVGISWSQPFLTYDITGIGAVRLFHSVLTNKPDARIYQASSSEMYGNSQEQCQDENTKFTPRSPYGCAKTFAHMSAINYRESYNMFISTGILFNHESPRRGSDFVTKKISSTVAKIIDGHASHVELGNVYSKRDWGYAPDYVEAMYRIMQYNTPTEFVIATGESHSVLDYFVETLRYVGFCDECDVGFCDECKYLKTSSLLSRPSELHVLRGNYSKAKKLLGWEPTIDFENLVKIMIKYETSDKLK